ncbi:MAG: DUF402 domain-containing protein [Ktedonobacteraceae bacterium]|nr:DUF402 domain-containing protein [Ktedonobacteraceae bacterium]
MSASITVVKLNVQKEPQIRYQGRILQRLANGLVIAAAWTRSELDLGYTRFEPGDHFTEYYYTDRWFNIFAIAATGGKRKGWYCNIAEPAVIYNDRIEQVDLLLDIWVNPQGQFQVLDEDEFAAADLSREQREGAQQGLQAVLQLLQARQEAFAELT